MTFRLLRCIIAQNDRRCDIVQLLLQCKECAVRESHVLGVERAYIVILFFQIIVRKYQKKMQCKPNRCVLLALFLFQKKRNSIDVFRKGGVL